MPPEGGADKRRLELADLLLLATVTLGALNFTVAKYIISHGFHPIAYSSIRFGAAAVIFAGLAWIRERSFAVSRRDLSALGFAIGTVPILAVASHQIATQDFGFPASIWLALVFSTLGPLVVANLLWFGAIGRVGPSRASVFANLQPFLAAVFSVLILSEPLSGVQVVGGLAIGAGIVLSRTPTRATVDTVTT